MSALLQTTRLILRSFTLADVDDVYRIINHFEIIDNTCNIPYPYTREMATQWIAEQQNNSNEQVFAITLKNTGELMGAIGLVVNQQQLIGTLGYWLGISFWNNGYMTEAASKVIEYGFKQLKLTQIVAEHFSRNSASGKVMQKAGMHCCGEDKRYIPLRQREETLQHYSIEHL